MSMDQIGTGISVCIFQEDLPMPPDERIDWLECVVKDITWREVSGREAGQVAAWGAAVLGEAHFTDPDGFLDELVPSLREAQLENTEITVVAALPQKKLTVGGRKALARHAHNTGVQLAKNPHAMTPLRGQDSHQRVIGVRDDEVAPHLLFSRVRSLSKNISVTGLTILNNPLEAMIAISGERQPAVMRASTKLCKDLSAADETFRLYPLLRHVGAWRVGRGG